MKAIALVCTFAALAVAAPAQDAKKKASEELANVFAVEEQERDLAKAEKLYREALAGKGLSAAARALATERLAGLLVRLDRRDEAAKLLGNSKPEGAVVTLDDVTNGLVQDNEREKVLREKARELVANGRVVSNAQSPLVGIEASVASQLLWIGEPAVPEVVAYLEAVPKASSYSPDYVGGLAAFLWRVGGAKAEAFLREANRSELLRPMVARAACASRSEATLAIAVEYVRAVEPAVSTWMLDHRSWGEPLSGRIDPAVLVDVMGKGSVEQRVWLLRWGGSQDTLVRPLLGVARAALASTEPALGTAALEFLAMPNHRADLDVIELLLDHHAMLLASPVRVWAPNKKLPLDRERARRWLPQVDACITARAPRGTAVYDWIWSIAAEVCEALDASVVPTVLRWMEIDAIYWPYLRGKIDASNAESVFSRFDRIPKDQKGDFLGLFANADTKPQFFPQLRAKANELVAMQPQAAFAFLQPMARTGNPDAATWIVEAWRKESNRDNDESAADALCELGRRTQHETVRAAMRTMAATAKPAAQSSLYLALLSMHDTAALAQMTNDIATHYDVVHPYAKGKQPPRITPLEYVLYEQPDPPHGFTAAELLAFVKTIAQWEGRAGNGRSNQLQPERVPTELVLALAEGSQRGGWARDNATFTWFWVAAVRIAGEDALDGPLHRWMDGHLQHPDRATYAADHLVERDVRHFRPRLDALLVGDDPDFASMAFDALNRCKLPLDFEALMESKHADVAQRAFVVAMSTSVLSVPGALRALAKWPNDRDSIAQYLGAKVAVEAVPALLLLLQDPERYVREHAAEALTRIRFHHEQQAYWDRIVKGLDASPASAAEKLLLQAKPGAGKDQRVLAITSLGTLGVPEALPFLIEWTQDADADVAKAAKDAITAIHLKPRR